MKQIGDRFFVTIREFFSDIFPQRFFRPNPTIGYEFPDSWDVHRFHRS
jgi:hypothetical protein